MRDPQFIVARSTILDQHAPGGAAAFAELITGAWPRDQVPDVSEALTIPELVEVLRIAQLDENEAGEANPNLPTLDLANRTPVVLVCWHGSESMARVAQLADRLLSLRIPAVFVVQRCDDSWQRFENAGLLIEPMEIKHSRLSSMLHAMLSQAKVVTEMREELRSADASQGGITGQINLLHEELNLASVIQRDLMPQEPPKIDDLNMSVLFRPAAYVSGDLFDLIRLDDGRLAFLLADAVGHGVPAALLTMLIHRAVTETRLRALRQSGPSQTIRAINSALASACPGGTGGDGSRFATAVFGLYDPSTHEVSLSVAGHPPPLRMLDGHTQQIDSHGPLLGVFEEAEFGEEVFTLRPGETLLLYSDGFEVAFPCASDTSPANEVYLQHFQHLGDQISKSQDVCAALGTLEASLDAQQGSLHQNDDITAIVLHRPLDAAPHAVAA